MAVNTVTETPVLVNDETVSEMVSTTGIEVSANTNSFHRVRRTVN